MVLNTLIKTFVLCLSSLLVSAAAHGSEGRFTLVPQGGLVPFEATCFDAEATAKLLTWKEFLAEEMRAQCELEKRTLILDSDLVIENMQITLDETQIRYQVEIDTRDNELEELRTIIKKNRKVNMPAVIISSVVGGIAIGMGGAYAIDQLLDK